MTVVGETDVIRRSFSLSVSFSQILLLPLSEASWRQQPASETSQLPQVLPDDRSTSWQALCQEEQH